VPSRSRNELLGSAPDRYREVGLWEVISALDIDSGRDDGQTGHYRIVEELATNRQLSRGGTNRKAECHSAVATFKVQGSYRHWCEIAPTGASIQSFHGEYFCRFWLN
jgi:hypothetical protein